MPCPLLSLPPLPLFGSYYWTIESPNSEARAPVPEKLFRCISGPGKNDFPGIEIKSSGGSNKEREWKKTQKRIQSETMYGSLQQLQLLSWW